MNLTNGQIVDMIKKYKSILSYSVWYKRDRGYNFYEVTLKMNRAQYLAEHLAFGDIKDNISRFSSTQVTFNIECI
jgi:hypothetical protein